MLSAAAHGTIRQVFRCSGRLAVAFAHRQRAIPFMGPQEFRVEQAGTIPSRCSPDAWMDAPRTTKTHLTLAMRTYARLCALERVNVSQKRITQLCALMRPYARSCAVMRGLAREYPITIPMASVKLAKSILKRWHKRA